MASKVSVGKTAPVPLGQQPAANSLPVVFAEDQQPIPVEEQNKIQSEVALSLLGIPRAEVALGIFADVNTYDVNPTEWAQAPLENIPDEVSGVGIIDGVEHIPDEAGARLVASDGNTTLLTSKRFFRYQPGRVSASTMGVKMNITEDPKDITNTATKNAMKGAPSLKKWGIFDKFDGYYFEIANAGVGNDFRCVRRTQAIISEEPSGYSGDLSWVKNGGDTLFNTSTNFGEAGVDPVIIRDGLVYTAAAIYDPSLCYSPQDVVAIGEGDSAGQNLKNYNFDSGYAVRLAARNSGNTAWQEKMNNRQYQFPFDQSTTLDFETFSNGEEDSLSEQYIRLDAHCNFFQTISNLNRKGTYTKWPTDISGLSSAQADADNWGLTIGQEPSAYSDLNTWDPSPSEDNNDAKIWHLMVNTQGFEDSKVVTTANLTNSTVTPNRTVTNGNITLKEWFNTCVPKPYRMVYEWRPVRAMFSGDKLDGAESVVRWSDINTAANDTTAGSGGEGAINRPGDPVLTADGEELTTQSVYNIDFTKVTMWKTEFSWYGAVGAVFLCYVPVSNGEARWVRVHHIRASNQHSVASLGNATLPITYLTHNSGKGNQPSEGNRLVKYGASYYIDGGDKGTVKLLSKASDYRRDVPPGFVEFPAGGNTATGGWDLVSGQTNVAEFDPSYSGINRASISYEEAIGLIGAYIEGDTTNKIKWVGQASASSNIKLYFTSALPTTSNTLKIIVPRAQKSLLSFRAKDFILNRNGDEVRNRLQIYPIKLGVGVSGGVAGDLITIKTIKNPLKIVSNGNISNTTSVFGKATPGTVRTDASTPYVNTKNSTLPVAVDFAGADPDFISNSEYRYGYFLGTTDSGDANTFSAASDTNIVNGTFFPVLGRLSKDSSGNYSFAKLFSYPDSIFIVGNFLPERHLELGEHSSSSGYNLFNQVAVTAGIHSSSSDQTKWDKLEDDSIVTWEEITRLSGARVGQDMKLTPIADTGNEILAYYSAAGGVQFDLQDYFAYNKEYLSFPLTDEVDIINIYGHYDINQSSSPTSFYVNTALTWEEQ